MSKLWLEAAQTAWPVELLPHFSDVSALPELVHSSALTDHQARNWAMQSKNISLQTKACGYWQNRMDKAEDDLSKAKTDELRVVYSELLKHYERMSVVLGRAPLSLGLIGAPSYRPS